MGDESTQTEGCEDSNEAKIAQLNKKIEEISLVNQVLGTENLEKAKEIEDAETVVACLMEENDKLKLQVKTLEEENESNLSRMHEYDHIIDFLQDQPTSMKEKKSQLASICKENNDLRSMNSLLTKRLQKHKEDEADLKKTPNNSIGQTAEDMELLIVKLKSKLESMEMENWRLQSELKNEKSEKGTLNAELENMRSQNVKLESELENMKLRNEKLQSELENVEPQKETSPSKVDKLTVLYRCSEREKYIASTKLLAAEEDIGRLRNELQSLQNFMASQNETEGHSDKSNGENGQALKLADLDVQSEVIVIEGSSSSTKDENLIQMKAVNVGENPETSATQNIKGISFLQEEIWNVVRKADGFCEKFEERFEEKIGCLITKITSCNDQIQILRKECVKLKEEKLVLLHVIKEVNGFLPNYTEQLEHFQGELAYGVEETCILRRKTRDFEMKVKSLQEFTREL